MAFASSGTKSAALIAPYGGSLVYLLVGDEERKELTEYAARLHSIPLSRRAIFDLEMLAVGAFSPLDRFMGKRDYKCVLNESRLASGHIFPIPVTLSVELTMKIRPGKEVALRDEKNNLLAVMSIQEIYEWDIPHEASRVFRRVDARHPFIAEMQRLSKVNISGPMRVLRLPLHHDLGDLCLTPAETRQRLQKLGRANVVAFQTRTPLPRAEEAWGEGASQAVDGSLLLHPVIGTTQPDGGDDFMRMRAYRAVSERFYASDRAMLALLPLAMRQAGPREAVWQMIIRRNYGANHLILGQNPIGLGNDAKGDHLFDPAEAEEIAQLYSGEIGVTVLPFKPFDDLEDKDRYEGESRFGQRMRFAPITPPAWV